MNSTHNEGTSVVAEKFTRTLKCKIYKEMTVNDNKTYLSYLNRLVDKFNNSYHHSICKKPINADTLV